MILSASIFRQRSFDYSAAKLLAAMEWRREYGAAAVTAADVARAMAPGHMYWAGEDRFRRPILYVRCARALAPREEVRGRRFSPGCRSRQKTDTRCSSRHVLQLIDRCD